MYFCEGYTLNWDAVGALGTWAVGLAAAWLAYKANAISAQLRHSETQREKAATRAMVIGLKLEAAHFAFRLKSMGEALKNLSAAFNDQQLMRAASSAALLEKVTLTDDSTRAALRQRFRRMWEKRSASCTRRRTQFASRSRAQKSCF